MHWPRFVALVAGMLALATLAVGCRGEPPAVDERFTVRLVTSAPLSGRWEREAERGLGRLAVELGADVARVRAWNPEDRRTVLQQVAADGADLVFCVGSGFEDLLFSEGPALGASRFVVVPGSSRSDTVASIRFLTEGAGYLAGAAAAALSGPAPVGVLRGAGRPWLEALESGFAAGVEGGDSRRPVVFAAGAEGAWELARGGVRTALYAADVPDAAALAAAHDAGLLLVAPDPMLMASMPDMFFAAVELDVAEAMVRLARDVRDGTFDGRGLEFDLGSGALDVHLSTSLGVVTPAVHERLAEARTEVLAGFVEVEELGI